MGAQTCQIKDYHHPVWVTGGVFKYKDCADSVIVNWYCEIVYDGATHRHHYLTEINHFRFEDLGTFLQPEDENHDLRHRLLVDSHSGRCFYPSIPAGTAANELLTGKYITLNTNMKTVMTNINKYTQT